MSAPAEERAEACLAAMGLGPPSSSVGCSLSTSTVIAAGAPTR
ncbi:hypothetical protein [Tessaracoccus coleopterorum]|nr:hypothetical protein [Tessaracoccus coleopterorum]